MKTKLLFLILLVTCYGFSQSVNDYKAVIVPVKYDFQNNDNEYRLNTVTKYNLIKGGFEAFYTSEPVSNAYNDRCDLLYVDVKKENGFLITKLQVLFKDCYGKIIFQSNIGKSKAKDFQLAYTEALNEAFKSVYALNYKYDNANSVTKSTSVVDVLIKDVTVAPVQVALINEESSTNVSFLFAQPIVNGFQLVDSTPKVVMKLYKTSSASCYMAEKDAVNGVLILKQGQWFFEYYKNDTFFSQKIEVKF